MEELEILSDDGRYEDDLPDSLWKLDPFELVSTGRAKFEAAWAARRLTPERGDADASEARPAV